MEPKYSTAYKPLTRLTPRHIEHLCQLYQQAWWAQSRSKSDIQQMLLHSDYVFGFCEADSQRLVAFARVLSDRVYRAVVLDVIVADHHRGQGLGTLLMQQVLAHPDLKNIELIQLFCLPEMVPFYEKFGFVNSPLNLLTRQRPVPR